MSDRPALADEAARRAAVEERGRSVLIEAGPGTGKTTLLVERLLARVAPGDDGPALGIGKIAVVMPTPAASVDFQGRARERLRAELAVPGLSATRAARLRAALEGLEAAQVGTAHDLAERLLRRRPMEAALGPAYELVRDPADFAREAASVLVEAAQAGTLAAELGLAAGPAGPADGPPAELSLAAAAEAERTVQDALRAGLRAETEDHEHAPRLGIDALVLGFVTRRDARARVVRAPFDRERFRRAADDFAMLARPLRGSSAGAAWLRGCACLAAAVRDEADPLSILRALGPALTALRDPTRRRGFEGDAQAWEVWKTLSEGRGRPVGTPLVRDLLDPAEEQLALRLARLEPVAVALYERVKRRRQTADPLDLLLRLRDLLALDRGAREEHQAVFGHVFVDEAEDLDPLAAEILLLLAGAPGRLTVAGDPRQSIFRFRRADVVSYEELRERLLEGGALLVTLSVSLRSRPPLVGWTNDRVAEVFATPSPTPGEARWQPLEAPDDRPGPAGPALHVIPLEMEGDPAHAPAMAWRSLEARALAEFLMWLVERSGVRVRGDGGEARPVGHGDVAVLAFETRHLGLLLAELDRRGVPYTARGGRLFIEDPLHRRFLLGLRALADPDDGAALAALLRPPFFAVDLEDLWRHEAGGGDEGARRVAAARARVLELRRGRLSRPPLSTARDLLEQTAFGRAVALGPGGARRLACLRDLCFVLGELATREGLDYDAATSRLRAWVERPPEIDAPPLSPRGAPAEAVQVLTVHQAKGLEFPVVVLWDGLAAWAPRERPSAWCVDGRSGAWSVCLHGEDRWHLAHGRALLAAEREHLLAERRRLVHVAVTRARDLLVLPRAGRDDEATIAGRLLRETRPGEALELAPYRTQGGAPWASPREVEPLDPAALPRVEAGPSAGWAEAALAAARPRFQPRGVAAAPEEEEAALPPVAAEDPPEPPAAPALPAAGSRGGRFGPVFEETVLRAVALLVGGRAASPAAAVRTAALQTGLNKRLSEAGRDVGRARAALRAEGLWAKRGVTLLVDYPIAGPGPGGAILHASIDLLAATADRVDVVAVTTEAQPLDPHELERHAAQLRAYAPLLEASGLTATRRLRAGVLFCLEGTLWWA